MERERAEEEGGEAGVVAGRRGRRRREGAWPALGCAPQRERERDRLGERRREIEFSWERRYGLNITC